MGLDRLNPETSLNNFYFCNASSGYPGFAPTFGQDAAVSIMRRRDFRGKGTSQTIHPINSVVSYEIAVIGGSQRYGHSLPA